MHLCWLSGVTWHGHTAASHCSEKLSSPVFPLRVLSLVTGVLASPSFCLPLFVFSSHLASLHYSLWLFLFTDLSSTLLSLPSHQISLPSTLSLGVGCCSHKAAAYRFSIVSPFRVLPGALVGLEHVASILASVQASTAHLINKPSPTFTIPRSPDLPTAACEDKGCIFVQGN